MNNLSNSSADKCSLCATHLDNGDSRCTKCVRIGNLVGDVVWLLVRDSASNANNNDRVAFMLAGLSAKFLEGIAHKFPGNQLEGKSLKLGINASSAVGLQVDSALETTESAVHWRHDDTAQIVVFAPSDSERDGIGAGLGSLARIDGEVIIGEIDAWLKFLDEAGQQNEYLRSVLLGLRRSGVCIDLDMWVEFILALKDQGFDKPVSARVQNAAHVLQIPRGGIEKLPRLSSSSTELPKPGAFQSAFSTAKNEVGVYSMLSTPKQEPVDIESVSARLNDIEAREGETGSDLEPELHTAIKVTRALLNDRLAIRPGDWRKSQEEFCLYVPWDRYGRDFFKPRGRGPKLGLGQMTLEYLRGDYEEDVSDELASFLEKVDGVSKDTGTTSEDEEREFFEKWRDRLSHKNSAALYRQWHKRVFSKEVLGSDLLLTLLKGFEALVAEASEDIDSMGEACVLIRADQHNKASFWGSLDKRIHRSFKFEAKALGETLSARFIWDIEKCFSTGGQKEQSSKTARNVPLELYLVERADVSAGKLKGNKVPQAPRVKAIWQPGKSPKDAPISLSLPDDIEQLAEAATTHGRITPLQEFATKTHNARGKQVSTTLSVVTTFSDVSQSDGGRTVDFIGGILKEDLLTELTDEIEAMRASKDMIETTADSILESIDEFRNAFSNALISINEDPANGFGSTLIETQATGFGNLCSKIHTFCTSDVARAEIMPRIAKIGIVPAAPGERRAILTAWHPLRLAEKKAKAQDFGAFADAVLTSGSRSGDLMDVAFAERSRLYEKWFFPEAAVLASETYISVEDVGGYSMLIPAGDVAQDRDALEQSSALAAKKFVDSIDDYLTIHPHESTNLSAAIYNSESASLPKELTQLLARRIENDSELRCDLVITHHDQRRMREIYEDQNTRLSAENINGNSPGFLSRLRVRVEASLPDNVSDGVRDIDLAFLHDSISSYSGTLWDHETKGASALHPTFDLYSAAKPRRRVGEASSRSTGIYLTIQRPPRAVAHYYDLLYTITKNAVLPTDMHAVLIRSVQFQNPEVQKTIQRVHDLAEWVVSFDQISNRQVLRECGVQIIRDISVPGMDSRVIISAKNAAKSLRARIKDELFKSCDFNPDYIDQVCEAVLNDVVEISGQKVLSAARYENAAREIIGLSVAKAAMLAALPAEADPIWISLDDYRGWFTASSGQIADIVAISILDDGDTFSLLLQVAEAKFVGGANLASETKKSLSQLRDTANRLRATFVDNHDPVSRAAWCSRLAELLVNRGDMSHRFTDPERRNHFFDCMSRGDVNFRLSGESVICIHDTHESEVISVADEFDVHLRQHKLPTPLIRSVLTALTNGVSSPQTEFSRCEWLTSEETAASSKPSVLVTKNENTLQNENKLDITEKVSGEIEEKNDDTHEADAREQNLKDDFENPGDSLSDATTVLPTNFKPKFIPTPVYKALLALRSREEGLEDDAETLKWVNKISEETQRALSHFNMHAVFSDPKYQLTPNGVLVTFRGHPSLTLALLEKRKNELLTTYGINVIDVRGGPGTISLFIQRPKRAKVHLASTWLNVDWPNEDAGILNNFIVGVREDDGQLLYLNLEGEYAGYEEHGPHTLIAGETKSGKGVLTQSLLLQLIVFNSPKNAELILIDPKKGVDFGWLSQAPHLRQPIVTTVDQAQSLFSSLVTEMDERYDQLADKGAANVSEYNSMVNAEQRMSRIFLFHDEIGAWMAQEKDYRETVLSCVANLGMKARAAGIHLVLITQRADVEAVPGKLRDNMGNRLCLKVQNSTGSQMILNCTGAEKLLGRGHLAATFTGEANPPGQPFFVAQVPFAPNADLASIASAATKFWSENQ